MNLDRVSAWLKKEPQPLVGQKTDQPLNPRGASSANNLSKRGSLRSGSQLWLVLRSPYVRRLLGILTSRPSLFESQVRLVRPGVDYCDIRRYGWAVYGVLRQLHSSLIAIFRSDEAPVQGLRE
jgi:hypothetical protein